MKHRLFTVVLVALLGAALLASGSCGEPGGRRAPASRDASLDASLPARLPANLAAHGAASGPVATAGPTTAAAAPPFECRWTDQPITLDGKEDEPAWRGAQVIDNFQIPWLSGPARKPRTATRAKLLWDREYLYFLAEMEDTDLYADVTAHNGATWKNDAFELFFKPADDKGGYYEFEVTPANTTLELFLPARGAGGYERFKDQTHVEMKTAVALRGTLNHWQDQDQGWTVEGRIPWRDLAPTGGRPNAGEAWKFALCRVDISVGPVGEELTTCAPLTRVDFHHYEDYATLRFVGPPPAADGGEGAGKPYGIDRRTPWITSRVVGSPDGPMPYTVAKAYPNLKIRQPLYVLEEPGTDKLLLLQHLGGWSGPSRVLRLKNDPAADAPEVLLHVDRLAYGMTLHPDFLHNGFVYLMSNGPTGSPQRQDRVSRFTVSRQAPHGIDLASEVVILEWDSNGHDGGDLAFGPDGMLYCSTGDGSSDSDANLRGQDLTHLTSAILRLDVDHPADGKAYAVPTDNPFLGTPGARPEVWAYGFRNPWRIAFDRHTGQLWAGQNGQDLWEQVYLVRKGENYGWSLYEGSHPFNLKRKQGPTPITGPVAEHPHSEMRSLTGGVVYYGSKLPELRGAYVYGDWSTGRIWAIRHDGTKVLWHKELARTPLQIVGFRETAAGELLVIDHGGGIYQLTPAPRDAPSAPFPRKLSETGLFASTAGHVPAAGLIPYSVNAPLWSDGAGKERFIALPGSATMEVTTSRGWELPEGAVLVKTFTLPAPGEAQADRTRGGGAAGSAAEGVTAEGATARDGAAGRQRRIETRLFTKQGGQWAGYSYLWNDEQTDATLVEAAGLDRPYAVADPAAAGGRRQQVWHFPSRAECMVCHTRAANWVLGISTLQLNKEHEYPAPSGHGAPGGDGSPVRDNQLRTLEHLGVLKVDYMGHARDALRRELLGKGMEAKAAEAAMWQASATRLQREPEKSTLLAFPPEKMGRLVNPSDASQPVEARARSYLHANCAICHVEAGGGNARMELEFTTPREGMRVLDVAPQHDTFGLPGARLVAPGDPAASVLLRRVAARGPGQMPPLATNVVDVGAVELLRQWVERLPPSPTSPAPAASAP